MTFSQASDNLGRRPLFFQLSSTFKGGGWDALNSSNNRHDPDHTDRKFVAFDGI